MDISVILPSKAGRLGSLTRAVESLTAGKDAGVEVIVGLDEGDPALEEASKLEQFPGVKVKVNPFRHSVGALFNLLGKESAGNWLIPFPDDYTVVHEDWADRLRKAVERLPLGLGVAYLKDIHYPGFTTFPVVSKRTTELNGFFMPEFFPFLFGDTWWNEIGNLTGIKQPIDARVWIQMEHGNEHQYRDFVLWARLFEKTRPMRVRTAMNIIKEIYGDAQESAFLISTMQTRSDMCENNQKHMFEDWFVERWDNTDPQPPSVRYTRMRVAAEQFLSQQF